MNLTNDIVGRFLDACYEAGIKCPERFLQAKMPQVYGWLRGAFPRNILPTDVDGEVEINGYFLRLEFKHESALRNGRVPKGQLMCFKSLIETGKFTVMLIGTDEIGTVNCYELWTRNRIWKLADVSPSELKEKMAKWSAWAEKQPRNKPASEFSEVS